jgi:hypothetical protein
MSGETFSRNRPARAILRDITGDSTDGISVTDDYIDVWDECRCHHNPPADYPADLSANGLMPRQFSMEEPVMCTIMREDWGIPKIRAYSSQEHLFQECPTPWPLAWLKAPQQNFFHFSFFFPKTFGGCKTTKTENCTFQNAKCPLVHAFSLPSPSMEEESN